MSNPANPFNDSFLKALAMRAGMKAVQQHTEEEERARAIGSQIEIAASLEAQAYSLSNLEHNDEALDRLQQAQQVLTSLNDAPRLTMNLLRQIELLEKMNDKRLAESLRKQAESLWKKSLNLHKSLAQRGLDLKSRGEYEAALQAHVEEETICRCLGLRTALARCVANQAVIHLHFQNADEAIPLLEQARDIFEAEQDLPGLSQTLENLGAVENQRQNPEAAASHYGAAAERYRAIPAEIEAARCTYEQAAALAKLERFTEALRLVESAEASCRRQAEPVKLADCLVVKTQIHCSANRFDLAFEVSLELEAIHRKLNDLTRAAQAMTTQAVCLRAMGRNGEARQRCQQAYDLARECNSEYISGIYDVLQSIPVPGLRLRLRSALGLGKGR